MTDLFPARIRTELARRFCESPLPNEQLANRCCSMCGPDFCAMKISREIK